MIRSIVCRRSFSLSSIRRHYRTTAGSLTVGNFIELNDRLYSVAEIEHVKKGRGNAFMQTQLKSLDGKKKHQRFRSDEKVEVAEVASSKLQCKFEFDEDDVPIELEDVDREECISFVDDNGLVQFVPKKIIGDLYVYLNENDTCVAQMYEDEWISFTFPIAVEATVKEVGVAERYSMAELENGRKIKVPSFVETGERILVKLPSEEYHGRAD